MEEKEQIFILSDSSQTNTKGFRVSLTGGRFERFDSNPVMLYDHDTKLVIGYWDKRKVEHGKLTAVAVFDEDDPVAAEKARKVRKRFLRGASMGIIPYKMEEVNDEWVLTDWEMIEASITPIPSDAGAVRLYNEKSEPITFEQLKLSINNKNGKQMNDNDTILLTAATLKSLRLSNPTARQVELAVQEKDDRIEELEKEVKKLKRADNETFLSQAVKDGKITEAEKADLLELSDTHPEKVKSLVNSKPVPTSTSLKDMVAKTNLTNGERASWSYMDWMKKDSDGLSKLKLNDPTAFERLKQTL